MNDEGALEWSFSLIRDKRFSEFYYFKILLGVTAHFSPTIPNYRIQVVCPGRIPLRVYNMPYGELFLYVYIYILMKSRLRSLIASQSLL